MGKILVQRNYLVYQRDSLNVAWEASLNGRAGAIRFCDSRRWSSSSIKKMFGRQIASCGVTNSLSVLLMNTNWHRMLTFHAFAGIKRRLKSVIFVYQ